MGDDVGTSIFLSLNSKLPYGEKSPRMEFFEAAFRGDVRRVREMASGLDAEGRARLADVCVGAQGPLQAAARSGRLDVVRCMVEELGFDINGSSPQATCLIDISGGNQLGITALAAAALGGQLDTVRYLLDNGADPNKKSHPASAPLDCAAKYGHDEVARLLLSRGASVDIGDDEVASIHIAAAYGKASFMKVLLEHHADPNAVSEVLGTPMIATLHATSEGLAESIALKCVKLLVEAGADVNSTDPDTPLVVATTHGLIDCIKYLLKAGADPNIPHNESGVLPIQIAACRGRRKDVEVLFPFTSPMRAVSKWSVEGVIAYVKAKHSKAKVEQCGKIRKDKLKLDGDKAVGRKDHLAAPKLCTEVPQCGKITKDKLKSDGDKAFGRKDYIAASKLYTEAIELDSSDATLYSNRSLCHMRIGDAKKALQDANACLKMRPEWLKGYYRKGAALMSLKEYKEACDALLAGLKLEPGNAEMERMFREAVEAMKKDHVDRKSLDSID
ncbi:hypothetical protein ACP70R_025175 [Stipagrostis hirtigluma subsp. patula]